MISDGKQLRAFLLGAKVQISLENFSSFGRLPAAIIINVCICAYFVNQMVKHTLVFDIQHMRRVNCKFFIINILDTIAAVKNSVVRRHASTRESFIRLLKRFHGMSKYQTTGVSYRNK